MGIVDLANRNSYWRGLDYFSNNKIIESKKIDSSNYIGKVKGTEIYNVIIDTEHPKKSKCTCPFANGKSKICKHMVALYFYNFPKEARKIIKEQKERERKIQEYNEKREKEQYERIFKYVNNLSVEQMKNELIGALIQIEDMNYEYYEEYDDFYDYY